MWKLIIAISMALGLYLLDIDSVNGVSVDHISLIIWKLSILCVANQKKFLCFWDVCVERYGKAIKRQSYIIFHSAHVDFGNQRDVQIGWLQWCMPNKYLLQLKRSHPSRSMLFRWFCTPINFHAVKKSKRNSEVLRHFLDVTEFP